MPKQKIKLPALTRADIEALPDGTYYLEGDAYLQVNYGEYDIYLPTMLDGPGDLVDSAYGGITARLVDPAPLVELLEKARAIINKGLHGMPSNGFQGEAQVVLDDLNAALEGNDG